MAMGSATDIFNLDSRQLARIEAVVPTAKSYPLAYSTESGDARARW